MAGPRSLFTPVTVWLPNTKWEIFVLGIHGFNSHSRDVQACCFSLLAVACRYSVAALLLVAALHLHCEAGPSEVDGELLDGACGYAQLPSPHNLAKLRLGDHTTTGRHGGKRADLRACTGRAQCWLEGGGGGCLEIFSRWEALVLTTQSLDHNRLHVPCKRTKAPGSDQARVRTLMVVMLY